MTKKKNERTNKIKRIINMKIEHGVMIMKDGKAWGINYADGHSTSYGWIDPESAPIHNPKYVKTPENVTWQGSPYISDLNTAKVVKVCRTTIVEIAE